MNRFKNLWKLSFALALVVALAACQSDSTESIDSTTETTVQDNNLVEMEGDALEDIADGEIMAPGSGKSDNHGQEGRLGGCASIEYDTVRTPGSLLAKRITITFAPNTICRDGRRRSGQIIVTWFGFLRDETTAGRVVALRTKNYFVNEHQLKLMRTRATVVALGQAPKETIVSDDTLILANNGGIAYNSTRRQRTWVQGFFTANPFDDVFNVTGFSTGKNRKEEEYRVQILQDVHIERACRWPISGVLQLARTSKPTATLDFGATTCDNLATLKVGDQSRVITLP